ncbi:MAG TPA: TetR/AcrR family transcriptional regulator [Candidatus Sulfotelmatobacter sp.]|nr:TetR/AcrR family transcriptional regulator [Candidatus Sulfotelmatobacter sp.]
MPWAPEHKPETRARILEAAAAALRERGVDAVGVAEIMRRAGLTHGGFYGHFRSKDELVAAAIPVAGADSEASLERLHGGTPATALLEAVTSYLSPEHLAHPERGCPLAALGSELVRGARPVRQSLAAQVRRRLSRLAELATGAATPARREQRAAGVLACMVGGMILARALPEADGRALLQDVREFVAGALAESG